MLSKQNNKLADLLRWIPCSARFVLLGQTPSAKGAFQIFQLKKGKLEQLADWTKEFGIKDCTFGHSSISVRDMACVDFKGRMDIYDIETGKSKFHVQAHTGLANTIHGIGGKGPDYGAPELVTGGADGCVRVWDPR